MPTTRQPLKQLKDDYDKWGILRELEMAHNRINALYVVSTIENLPEDLESTDVDTAAKIATRLNATNTVINAILEKLRLSS